MAKAKTISPLGQINLPLKIGQVVTPQRAAELITKMSGIPTSRQTVLRRIEEGRISARRLHERGRIWVLRESLMEYIQALLAQDCITIGT